MATLWTSEELCHAIGKMMFDKAATDKSVSIQDIAIKLLDEQLRGVSVQNEPKERTVFFLGSKGSGKTTAIYKFFEKEESPRPTLALEYSYGRRTSSSQGIHKQILNVWELGSLENSTELLEVPLSSHGTQNLAVMLFVNLAEPKRLWNDLETAHTALRSTCSRQLSGYERGVLLEQVSERVGKDHPDWPTMDLLPFPLVIVGAKYDVFMDFDPELKKHVCRCLRSMAHTLGAALLFYSHHIPKLSKTLKDTISHLGFGSPSQPFRTFNVDYNGPLSVWFGSDTWDQIGMNSLPIERIGVIFKQEVPQAKANKSSTNDPARDPGFSESIVDEMRAQKNEELAAFIKESQVRAKFETIV